MPDTTQQYWCDNQTSGAFTLTIGTNAQASPPTLDPGQTAIMYSNSIEVIDAVNAVSVMFPIQISQGGTGATNAADARTNLDVPSTSEVVPPSRILTAGDALNGGGDLSADRTFDVQVGLGLNIPGGIEIALDLTDTHNTNHANVDLIGGTGISAAGLGDITASRTINANLATEILEGVLEVASQVEADAGLLDNKIMTPLKVANLPGGGGDVIVTTGTFVPGWTGFSANPTATMRWTKFDPITPGADTLVILRHDSGNPTGTSNATGFSMTGLPATIVPSTFGAGAQCHALFTDNTAFNHVGAAQVNITAVMSFFIESVSGSRVINSLSGWTASGLKGWSNNSHFIYSFEP